MTFSPSQRDRFPHARFVHSHLHSTSLAPSGGAGSALPRRVPAPAGTGGPCFSQPLGWSFWQEEAGVYPAVRGHTAEHLRRWAGPSMEPRSCVSTVSIIPQVTRWDECVQHWACPVGPAGLRAPGRAGQGIIHNWNSCHLLPKAGSP